MTTEFKLQPCDILLFKVEGEGVLPWLEREFVGGYSHVSMYLGPAFGDYFEIESNLRGASLVSLSSEKGRLVKVMRPTITAAQKEMVISNAIKLTSTERAFYDYPVIVMSCVPSVLKMKLPWLPIPVSYCRDIWVICSEVIAECYWRAYIIILPKDVVPLPVDFLTSSILVEVFEGKVYEDIFPGEMH